MAQVTMISKDCMYWTIVDANAPLPIGYSRAIVVDGVFTEITFPVEYWKGIRNGLEFLQETFF